MTEFEAVIKKIQSKTTASNDKVGTIILEFYPDINITLNKLNDLHKSDETVIVSIKENPQGYDLNG